MEDLDSPSDTNWRNQEIEKLSDPTADSAVSGRSMLGFSPTSPDLVICSGSSPDLPINYRDNSADLFEKGHHKQKSDTCVELSLNNGIDGPSETTKRNAVRFSTVCDTFPWSPESSLELLLQTAVESQGKEINIADVDDDCGFKGEIRELVTNYKQQKRELLEARRAMEELKKENQLKATECHEAWTSLQDLQNELMRKSMHVGSLEGQVKENSRWFTSLRDLTRKLKIMKMEQIKLSEEASAYRNYMADMNEMSSIIQWKMNQQEELHAKKQNELYNKV